MTSITNNHIARKTPPSGGGYTTVQHGACPACHRATLRYSLGTHDLACSACPWRLRLTDAEHEDFTFMQVWPDGVVSVCAFLAAVAQRAHVVAVTPDPKAVYTRERKWRVLPTGSETFAERAARLSEQAILNDVEVNPMQRDAADPACLVPWDGTGIPFLFRVSSQRRQPDGTRLRWYAPVEVSSHQAHCPCDAAGLCAHLLAVKDWLLAWDAAERERQTAQPPVAYTHTGKYADLWDE